MARVRTIRTRFQDQRPGRPAGRTFTVQSRLQNHHRRRLIDDRTAFASFHTGLAQTLVCGHGTQPLVDKAHRNRGHASGDLDSVRARKPGRCPLGTGK